VDQLALMPWRYGMRINVKTDEHSRVIGTVACLKAIVHFPKRTTALIKIALFRDVDLKIIGRNKVPGRTTRHEEDRHTNAKPSKK